MVIVSLTGGLGNQMFQYAAGRALADVHHTELKYRFEDHYKLAQRQLRLTNFNISGSLVANGEGRGYFPLRLIKRRVYKFLGRNVNGKTYFEKTPYSFDKDFFNTSAEVHLIGFWQSYRYFESIESIIRREFGLKVVSPKFLYAEHCVIKFNNTVSIHIRRTDYTNADSMFGSLDLDYYKAAIRKMESVKGKCTPIIFTDDPDWAKQNFVFLDNPVFVSDFKLEDFEELVLMAKCSNNIIANSSFSWWGAWLNSNPDKLVISPKEWHFMHTEESTLIPSEWLQLK